MSSLHIEELDSCASQQLQMLHTTLAILFNKTCCSTDAACGNLWTTLAIHIFSTAECPPTHAKLHVRGYFALVAHRVPPVNDTHQSCFEFPNQIAERAWTCLGLYIQL